jgi:hypothetical protein
MCMESRSCLNRFCHVGNCRRPLTMCVPAPGIQAAQGCSDGYAVAGTRSNLHTHASSTKQWLTTALLACVAWHEGVGRCCILACCPARCKCCRFSREQHTSVGCDSAAGMPVAADIAGSACSAVFVLAATCCSVCPCQLPRLVMHGGQLPNQAPDATHLLYRLLHIAVRPRTQYSRKAADLLFLLTPDTCVFTP